MITDKLTIYGENSKAELVRKLLLQCSEKLSISVADTVVCLDDSFEEALESTDAQHLVIDYKYVEKLIEKDRAFTYSLSDSRADVAALNIQQRTHSVCFELLNGSFMSRIFIPLTNEHTPYTVIVTCCVLILWSVPAEKIVETINELLK